MVASIFLLLCIMTLHGASQEALVVKNPPANAGDIRDTCSTPGSGKTPWRRARQPTPLFLPGESHGQRSLAGYSPAGCKESDTTAMTEHTHARGPLFICDCSTIYNEREPKSQKKNRSGFQGEKASFYSIDFMSEQLLGC